AAPTTSPDGGAPVAALREQLRAAERATARQLHRQRAAARTATGGAVLPDEWSTAIHEAAHAVAAVVLGLELERVTGASCCERTLPRDVRAAVYACCGAAAGRGVAPESRGAQESASDLAVARHGMVRDTQPHHWREVRRRAH